MAGLEPVTCFARILNTNPWEEDQECIEIDYAQNEIKSIWAQADQAEFDQILPRNLTTVQLYNIAVKPLCDSLSSNNSPNDAVYVSYGQSGTRKTRTLLGDYKNEYKGLISLAVEELLSTAEVQSLSVSVLEGYGRGTKMEFYDLLHPKNQCDSWSEKKPSFAALSSREITNQEDIRQCLMESSIAAHTVQRRQSGQFSHRKSSSYLSNRGHVIYLLKVTVRNKKEMVYLSFMDLSGSDTDNLGGYDVRIRKTESKCLNIGSNAVRDWLRKSSDPNHQISKSSPKQSTTSIHEHGGCTGMDKLLTTLFNKENLRIMVVLNISPSITNVQATRYTLRFAKIKKRNSSRSSSVMSFRSTTNVLSRTPSVSMIKKEEIEKDQEPESIHHVDEAPFLPVFQPTLSRKGEKSTQDEIVHIPNNVWKSPLRNQEEYESKSASPGDVSPEVIEETTKIPIPSRSQMEVSVLKEKLKREIKSRQSLEHESRQKLKECEYVIRELSEEIHKLHGTMKTQQQLFEEKEMKRDQMESELNQMLCLQQEMQYNRGVVDLLKPWAGRKIEGVRKELHVVVQKWKNAEWSRKVISCIVASVGIILLGQCARNVIQYIMAMWRQWTEVDEVETEWTMFTTLLSGSSSTSWIVLMLCCMMWSYWCTMQILAGSSSG